MVVATAESLESLALPTKSVGFVTSEDRTNEYDDAKDDVETERKEGGGDDKVEEFDEEQEAQELLDRYGLGAGMRMYARSVALLAQAEKEKALTAAADDAAAADAAALPTTVVPSFHSAVGHESVKDAIDRKASSSKSVSNKTKIPAVPKRSSRSAPSSSPANKNKNKSVVDNKKNQREYFNDAQAYGATRSEEEESVYTKASELGSLYQHGETALTNLFRQAEAFAAKYNDNLCSHTALEDEEATPKKSRKSSSRATTQSKWFSSLLNSTTKSSSTRKPPPLAEKSLSLDDEIPAVVSVVHDEEDMQKKQKWWSSLLKLPETINCTDMVSSANNKRSAETNVAKEAVADVKSWFSFFKPSEVNTEGATTDAAEAEAAATATTTTVKVIIEPAENAAKSETNVPSEVAINDNGEDASAPSKKKWFLW